MLKGQMGDVITCPEFSDADNWAAIADPRLASGIILGERFGVLPEIVIADGETNGACSPMTRIRMKVRHMGERFRGRLPPALQSQVA
jgi:hypothetical protein